MRKRLEPDNPRRPGASSRYTMHTNFMAGIGAALQASMAYGGTADQPFPDLCRALILASSRARERRS